jgi:hypothetical protein
MRRKIMKKLNQLLLSTLVVAMFLVFSIGAVQAGPCELPVFNSANFGSPQDNPYLPKSVIGKTYVYKAEEEDGLIVNYIQFTTDTKLILGVTCTVVYDVEYLMLEDGSYVKLEETWDWLAWDNFGNFWYFGEDTTEYEYDDDWNLIGCNNDGAWEAGQDVAGAGSIAEPGIILPADPGPGDCNQQEYYEDEAEDVGKVLKVKATCEDPVGNESEECMVMKEWTALEPGNVEHKIYFPGVGLVHIKELKEKTVEDELVEMNIDPVPDLDNPICP